MIFCPICHWAKDCQLSFENRQRAKVRKKTNTESNYLSLYSDTMKYFVVETVGMAVLDSGCSENV